MESDFHYCIDRLVVFMQTVHVAGWAFSERAAVRKITFLTRSGLELRFSRIGLPSEDVGKLFGQRAFNSRFDEHWLCDLPGIEIHEGKVIVELDDGTIEEIVRLGAAIALDPTHVTTRRFFDKLGEMLPGTLLEIGSRARSGLSRRNLVPSPWKYVGLDILEGENVDLVGDAHQLSKIFPANSFRAIMAFSVLEHILMPWKFVVELNRVMEVNGIGYLTTHQCWPLHDEPWDYWRFSAHSWKALFNSATGFRVLDAQSGEPAYVVANSLHSAVDFPVAPGGFLSSVVLFQKESETSLEWGVELSSVVTGSYPPETTDLQLR